MGCQTVEWQSKIGAAVYRLPLRGAPADRWVRGGRGAISFVGRGLDPSLQLCGYVRPHGTSRTPSRKASLVVKALLSLRGIWGGFANPTFNVEL